MASFSAIRAEVLDREERKRHYVSHLMGLNAYDRHKKFMHDYVLHYNKSSAPQEQRQPLKTDQDTLRETYRFIRTEDDDVENSWEQRLAKRYYDKLFREYCIADMSRYKDGKVGLRWRSEKEVISGKGQFVCGSRKCDAKEGLSSYEVNFAYNEAGQSKQALVKLRVCPRCADKLNYKREKDREKLLLSHDRENGKHKRSEEPQEKSRRLKKTKYSTDTEGKSDDDEKGHCSSSPPSKGQLMGCQEEYDKYFKGMFL